MRRVRAHLRKCVSTFASWILVAQGPEAGYVQLVRRAARCLKEVCDFVESKIGTVGDCALDRYGCRSVIVLISRIGREPGKFKEQLHQIESEDAEVDEVRRD